MKTNHAVVGFYVAKSWRIPMRICSCILNHHERDLLSSPDNEQNNLLATLKIAEAISHALRRMSDNPEWERLQGDVLDYLNLSTREFDELREDMGDKLSLAA